MDRSISQLIQMSTTILYGVSLTFLLNNLCIICLMDKQKFIALAGSQRDLAKLLGISQAAVSQWVKVPPARVWQLQVLKPSWFS